MWILRNLGQRESCIRVWNGGDPYGDRSLTLRHFMHNRRPLGDSTAGVLKHVARLWGYTLRVESVDDDGQVAAEASCEI